MPWRNYCHRNFLMEISISYFHACSCTRTGTEANQTAISCRVRTVWWWCGTMAVAGVMFPATITWHTPARKAQVSKRNWWLFVLLGLLGFFDTAGINDRTLFNVNLSKIFQQPHVVHRQKSETPPYLKSFARDMRQTQLCVITVLQVSGRDLILWSGVCLEASGRNHRSFASMVRSKKKNKLWQ